MKEEVKYGLPKAILSTLWFYTKKTFKWAAICIASAEAGMHSCDMIASQTNAWQKYEANAKRTVEEEENLFGIKFDMVPEVVVGYMATRNAVMSNIEKDMQYEKMATAEKVPAKMFSYLIATGAAISFNSFLGPRIFGGQIGGLSIDGKIYLAPKLGETEFTEWDNYVLSHEIFHAYINQKNPSFNQPYYGADDAKAKELAIARMTAHEGLATYCATRMGLEKGWDIARRTMLELVRVEQYCPARASSLENKMCQYIIGFNFVETSLLLLGNPLAVDTIIQNPPNTSEEILNPTIYVERITKEKK